MPRNDESCITTLQAFISNQLEGENMKRVATLGLIIDRVNTALAVIVTVVLVLLSVAVVLNAVIRLYGFYFLGLLELSRFSLIWITFCGAAWLLRRNGHVNVNAIVAQLNPKAHALLDVITSSFNLLLFAIIAWYSAKITWSHFQTNFIMGDSALYLPKAPVEIIIPLGCLLLAIELFRKANKRWADWKTPVRR